jgi:transcriptional regulator with XRE-family HTH domain
VARVVLAKILKEKKITKYRFAKMIGSDYSNIVRYFKPDFNPRLSTLEKWSEVLDVSVKDLIED